MKPPGADPHPPRSMGQVPHSLGERGPPPPVSSSLLTALGGHGEGWASSMQHHAASELWAPMRAISHSTSPLRGPVASRFPLNSLCSKLKCLGGCDLGLAQHKCHLHKYSAVPGPDGQSTPGGEQELGDQSDAKPMGSRAAERDAQP